MKQIKIPCRYCGGSGKQDLPIELYETLQAIKDCGNEATIDGVFSELKTKAGADFGRSAVSNRLTALYNMKLVTRQKKSREWVYSL